MVAVTRFSADVLAQEMLTVGTAGGEMLQLGTAGCADSRASAHLPFKGLQKIQRTA